LRFLFFFVPEVVAIHAIVARGVEGGRGSRQSGYQFTAVLCSGIRGLGFRVRVRVRVRV